MTLAATRAKFFTVGTRAAAMTRGDTLTASNATTPTTKKTTTTS